MRGIKELLEVLLKNQQYFRIGLCAWVDELHRKQIISFREKVELHTYIISHRPSMFSSVDAWINRESSWFWPSKKIAPRIKWIYKHISKQERLLNKLKD